MAFCCYIADSPMKLQPFQVDDEDKEQSTTSQNTFIIFIYHIGKIYNKHTVLCPIVTAEFTVFLLCFY